MKTLETILGQVGAVFFAEANHINILLSFLSFIIGALLMPFSFGTGQIAINRRRFCGAFLLLSLAFEAASASVYALSVFIVATLITELNFLSGLAAIFWNRPWAYQRPATPEEIASKKSEEAEFEASGLSSVGSKHLSVKLVQGEAERLVDSYSDSGLGQRPVANFRGVIGGAAFEDRVFQALIEANLFDDLQKDIALTTSANPGRPLVIVDGIGKLNSTRYVIEVKNRPDPPQRIAQHLQLAMTALKNTPELQSGLIHGRVRGILVTGRTDSPAVISGENVTCLIFDSDSGRFTNIDVVKKWMTRA